jgi:hypothetical protein
VVSEEAGDSIGWLDASSAEGVGALSNPRAQLSPRDHGPVGFGGFNDSGAVFIDGGGARKEDIFGEV